jgi:hypothetical protein
MSAETDDKRWESLAAKYLRDLRLRTCGNGCAIIVLKTARPRLWNTKQLMAS